MENICVYYKNWHHFSSMLKLIKARASLTFSVISNSVLKIFELLLLLLAVWARDHFMYIVVLQQVLNSYWIRRKYIPYIHERLRNPFFVSQQNYSSSLSSFLVVSFFFIFVTVYRFYWVLARRTTKQLCTVTPRAYYNNCRLN